MGISETLPRIERRRCPGAIPYQRSRHRSLATRTNEILFHPRLYRSSKTSLLFQIDSVERFAESHGFGKLHVERREPDCRHPMQESIFCLNYRRTYSLTFNKLSYPIPFMDCPYRGEQISDSRGQPFRTAGNCNGMGNSSNVNMALGQPHGSLRLNAQMLG